MHKSNPLLEQNSLPPFRDIKAKHIGPAIDQILADNRARIVDLLQQKNSFTWDELVLPLEMLAERLAKAWSPVTNLHMVMSDDDIRSAYHETLPKLTEYHTELEQNKELCLAFRLLAGHDSFKKLDHVKQKIVQNALRDFRLAGVDLPEEAKQRYGEIQTQLAKLATQFEENVLDATQSWFYHTTDLTELAGIPQHILEHAAEMAKEKKLKGYVLTLDFPCYFPVMSYAHNRALREKIYTAYVTRASDQGPDAGKYDNSKVLCGILMLRHELSKLLGFENYMELSLQTKMVKLPKEILGFLQNLAIRAKTKGTQELLELQELAKIEDNLEELQAWDIPYYSEKCRIKQYAIDDELLRPYFPLEQVLTGLFTIAQNLFQINIVKVKNKEVWHKDVSFYEVYDDKNQLRGQFYLDLFARKNKQGGAWMDTCIERFRLSKDKLQVPVAFLTCNLTPPSRRSPALLTHDEVLTLFHEFGHGLHHLLTQIDYPSVAGIHGVSWDAVELPSQFMEFFAWKKEGLDLISRHYKTGKPLPEELQKKLLAAKNFQSGLQMLRQIEFSIFDFLLHSAHLPFTNTEEVLNLLTNLRNEIALIKVPSWHRFPHNFTHIFSGGYGAGYYSYLWAEMLASDVFSLFEETGVFNAKAGKKFLKSILEQGGAKEALDLFIEFRGREPRMDAFLADNGIG